MRLYKGKRIVVGAGFTPALLHVAWILCGRFAKRPYEESFLRNIHGGRGLRGQCGQKGE